MDKIILVGGTCVEITLAAAFVLTLKAKKQLQEIKNHLNALANKS